MPSFTEIGDSEAVDNSYVDKLIFYVEGDDDQNLFNKFFFRHTAQSVEVKQPPGLEGGYVAVMSRVADERPKNPKVFGIVDGEALLAIGEISLYKDFANGTDWIWLDSNDGIVSFPCWEIENVLFKRVLIIPNLDAWLWNHKNERWSDKKILRFLLCEIFRLTEIAAFNCALHEMKMSPIRAETKTELHSRRDVLTELLADSSQFQNKDDFERAFEVWRQFFRNFLGNRWNPEGWYDDLMNRVDGKALFVRIRKRAGTPANFLGILAKNFMESPDTNRMIHCLIEEATSKAT